MWNDDVTRFPVSFSHVTSCIHGHSYAALFHSRFRSPCLHRIINSILQGHLRHRERPTLIIALLIIDPVCLSSDNLEWLFLFPRIASRGNGEGREGEPLMVFCPGILFSLVCVEGFNSVDRRPPIVSDHFSSCIDRISQTIFFLKLVSTAVI